MEWPVRSLRLATVAAKSLPKLRAGTLASSPRPTPENVYAYSAYGEVAVLGPDGGNSLQYTGRENDRTSLYYYRARTFDPVLKRFTSEDPIGIDGGINLYSYVGGDPISYTDPTGTQVTFGHGARHLRAQAFQQEQCRARLHGKSPRFFLSLLLERALAGP